MSKLISNNELLNELIRLKNLLGRNPTQKEVASLGKYCNKAYLNRFGGLTNSFKLIENDFTENITDEDLIKELLSITKQLGRLPKIKDFKICKIPYKTFALRFLGLNNIREIIKKNRIKTIKQKISDKELIEELLRLRNIMGRKLKVIDFEQSKYTFATYDSRFGGIENILKLIEDEPLCKKITNKQLLDNLIEIKERIERIPTQKDLLSNKYPLYMFKLRFGNFHNALELINSRPPSNKSTDEELRNEIIRLKEIYNRYPTVKEVAYNSIYSIYRFIFKYGGFVKTIYKLGFDDYIPYSTKVISKSNNNFFISTNINDRTSKDGNLYISAFEALIANKLFDLKNQNKINDYKFGVQVCKGRRWTCDFVITLNDNNKIFLECDGMMNTRLHPYDKDNEKINYYKNNNINLIIIKYKDRNCDLEKILSI